MEFEDRIPKRWKESPESSPPKTIEFFQHRQNHELDKLNFSIPKRGKVQIKSQEKQSSFIKIKFVSSSIH